MIRCQHRDHGRPEVQCVRVKGHEDVHEPNIPGNGPICQSYGPASPSSDPTVPGGFYPRCRRLARHSGVHAWWQTREISIEWPSDTRPRSRPPTRLESAEHEVIQAAIQMVYKGRLPSVPGQPGWTDGIARLDEAVARYQKVLAEMEAMSKELGLSAIPEDP